MRDILASPAEQVSFDVIIHYYAAGVCVLLYINLMDVSRFVGRPVNEIA